MSFDPYVSVHHSGNSKALYNLGHRNAQNSASFYSLLEFTGFIRRTPVDLFIEVSSPRCIPSLLLQITNLLGPCSPRLASNPQTFVLHLRN